MDVWGMGFRCLFAVGAEVFVGVGFVDLPGLLLKYLILIRNGILQQKRWVTLRSTHPTATAWFVLYFAFSCLPHKASGETRYSYEPVISKISGYILVEKVDNQGPPYWGENPPNTPKISILIIVPDRPISVIANNRRPRSIFDQDSFFAVKVLELTNPYSLDLERYVGKHVMVQGKLFERTFGYQYTDVLLLVHKIILLDRNG